jgi:hypothetical protein
MVQETSPAQGAAAPAATGRSLTASGGTTTGHISYSERPRRFSVRVTPCEGASRWKRRRFTNLEVEADPDRLGKHA